jgi:hypothetical protein
MKSTELSDMMLVMKVGVGPPQLRQGVTKTYQIRHRDGDVAWVHVTVYDGWANF